MPKINIFKIILLISISLLIVTALGLAFVFYTLNDSNLTNNTEVAVSSLSSSASSNPNSTIDTNPSSQNNNSTNITQPDQNPTDNNTQSASNPANNSDQGNFEDLLEDPDLELDNAFREIRTRFLFSENDIKVYTSPEKRINGNGWAGNLGINPSIFFVDSHTYIDYQGKTYYIGPSVDYINLINGTWYLAVQTDYNEYILYSCDFECKNQEIIIPYTTKKIVNVGYTDNKDRIRLSTIAVNDRYAVPVDEEYEF